jgi:hypothetical protein
MVGIWLPKHLLCTGSHHNLAGNTKEGFFLFLIQSDIGWHHLAFVIRHALYDHVEFPHFEWVTYSDIGVNSWIDPRDAFVKVIQTRQGEFNAALKQATNLKRLTNAKFCIYFKN